MPLVPICRKMHLSLVDGAMVDLLTAVGLISFAFIIFSIVSAFTLSCSCTLVTAVTLLDLVAAVTVSRHLLLSHGSDHVCGSLLRRLLMRMTKLTIGRTVQLISRSRG